MKKSEIYVMAQTAVINSSWITPDDKLEILRVLMSDEDVARYTENREVKE